MGSMPSQGDAVVLLSGGLDSATVLALAVADGLRCHAVSFSYGQRHGVEIQAARDVARALGAADHRVLPLPIGQLGGSALTDTGIDVPRDRSAEEMADGIPSTYVPARNTIFLAFALAVAEVTESDAIYLGVNAVDYSGYPDCRPDYVEAWRQLAALATKRAVEGRVPSIICPLISMSKADIIRTGIGLGVDYKRTVSCYEPDSHGRACGRCDSCGLRRRGFAEAGVPDPTVYQEGAG
jgi:7-cyano-7-deazaguanine synthase